MEIVSVILPIFLIFGIGYVGQKRLHLDPKNASTLALYLLSPFLVFRTFYAQPIGTDFFYLCLYAVLLCVVLNGSVYLYSWLRGYDRSTRSALMLAIGFMNNGNYGTPVVLFAFGAAGFDVAVMLMVIQQLLMSTVGIFIAAQGSTVSFHSKQSVLSVVKMPILYGAIAGILFQLTDVTLPVAVMNSVNLVGDAAIPTIMIILGMQLATIGWKVEEKGKLVIAVITRLLVSPLIAFCLTLLLPVDELTQAIMIIMAATPTAANTTMFAIQFQTQPELVSRVTLFSTVLSVLTMPIVILFVT